MVDVDALAVEVHDAEAEQPARVALLRGFDEPALGRRVALRDGDSVRIRVSDVRHRVGVAHLGRLHQVLEGRPEVLLHAVRQQVRHGLCRLGMSVVSEPFVVQHLLLLGGNRLEAVGGPPVEQAVPALRRQPPVRRGRGDDAERDRLIVEGGRVAALLDADAVHVPESERHLRDRVLRLGRERVVEHGPVEVWLPEHEHQVVPVLRNGLHAHRVHRRHVALELGHSGGRQLPHQLLRDGRVDGRPRPASEGVHQLPYRFYVLNLPVSPSHLHVVRRVVRGVGTGRRVHRQVHHARRRVQLVDGPLQVLLVLRHHRTTRQRIVRVVLRHEPQGHRPLVQVVRSAARIVAVDVVERRARIDRTDRTDRILLVRGRRGRRERGDRRGDQEEEEPRERPPRW